MPSKCFSKLPGVSKYHVACFLKAPETFWACKAIFSSSVSKNGEVFIPETSGVKRSSLHNKNM